MESVASHEIALTQILGQFDERSICIEAACSPSQRGWVDVSRLDGAAHTGFREQHCEGVRFFATAASGAPDVDRSAVRLPREFRKHLLAQHVERRRMTVEPADFD